MCFRGNFFCGVNLLSKRKRHLHDSHGQILALVFRQSSLKPWIFLYFCSEAVGCVDHTLSSNTHARCVRGMFQTGRSKRWTP